jgi:hypothetical protein
VYSDEEIAALLTAEAELAPANGLRQHCYRALFGLLLTEGWQPGLDRCSGLTSVAGVASHVQEITLHRLARHWMSQARYNTHWEKPSRVEETQEVQVVGLAGVQLTERNLTLNDFSAAKRFRGTEQHPMLVPLHVELEPQGIALHIP